MYHLAITLYAFVVRLVSPFNPKAKKMLTGQRKTFSILKEKIDKNARYIWFHAASLGEFEQGRPLIEKIRNEKPEYKILLTFFSPSGYEIRKNYESADIVCYLPFDYLGNARKFLRLVHPEIAVFIKYEFWMNYLNKLKDNNIPTYIISAIFRPNQIFFRWYGRHYSKVLNDFDWFFVQNERSRQLLNHFKHNNITVCGDTRFDRVKQIADKAERLPVIEHFIESESAEKPFILVAGSSWEQDEEILFPFFNTHPEIKLIIAPHEMNGNRIANLTSRLKRTYILYSQAKEQETLDADCLVIDCFGLLSTIYRYGQIAYIGGGCGKGIHNIVEAAVYGIPVIFGANYVKSREASELIDAGGAFSVSSQAQFNEYVNSLLSYPNLLAETGEKTRDYVNTNLGATKIIFEKIFGMSTSN
ncbi:MAG: 3-deoxy-D-manno-octulosonic acid transferase [Dysgonamonadaceae bacterium]|jgi:3-deoxy-D-manno-octulosonic-acid transferase|nr:3-deoxy-D-manno-octulosonic acid transferase [Dysgonamonadaceae bacterium]